MSAADWATAKLVDNGPLSAPSDKDFDNNSVQRTMGALDVWWEILSVLAPVVFVALLDGPVCSVATGEPATVSAIHGR